MPFVPKAWDETDPITPSDLIRIENGIRDVTAIAEQGIGSWIDVGGGGGNPAFANNWSNYAPTTSKLGFRKDVNGVVYLRGFIKHSTGTGVLPAAFTLPAGYRPTVNLSLPTTIALNTGMVVGRITVSTSGVVTPDRTGSASVVWVSLDGLLLHTT